MLTAYFDESSTENSQFRRFLISGYVSNEREWRQFERKWRHALVCDGFQKHGIHWTDLAAGKEDFESLAGPANEKRRERLQRKYLRIIRSAPLHGLHSSFDMNDFERALPSIRKVRQSKPYRLAYYHAFESVVGRLCALLQANSMLDADEQVAFVFDRNDQTQERAKEIYDHMIQQEHIWFWKHLGPITFAPMKDVLPLQASDALANELQRDLSRGTARRRWQLERLLDGDQVSDFDFTREMFDDFAERLDKAVEKFHKESSKRGDR